MADSSSSSAATTTAEERRSWADEAADEEAAAAAAATSSEADASALDQIESLTISDGDPSRLLHDPDDSQIEAVRYIPILFFLLVKKKP